jgi:1,4-dihydroxy-2-naphthoate octaprenyltransferase
MASLHIWLEATRPKTLPAALVPVLLASSLAYVDGCFNWRAATICFLFALLIQIGTNFANDYLDGIKGTDTDKRLGPRRAVATGLIAPATMKRATILVLAIGFCIGLGLIPFGGWWLLVVGVASVACAWLYTGGPYPLAYNGLGDVFVVLFFGFVAVGCSYYVQVGTISFDALLLGLGCGLLVNNLLVVNNYRDVEEDLAARKRTLVVFFGRKFARVQYILSVLLAGVVVIYFGMRGYGLYLLIALAPIAFGLVQGRRLSAAESAQDFLELLKGSAKVVFAYGVLFSVGLLVQTL